MSLITKLCDADQRSTDQQLRQLSGVITIGPKQLEYVEFRNNDTQTPRIDYDETQRVLVADMIDQLINFTTKRDFR